MNDPTSRRFGHDIYTYAHHPTDMAAHTRPMSRNMSSLFLTLRLRSITLTYLTDCYLGWPLVPGTPIGLEPPCVIPARHWVTVSEKRGNQRVNLCPNFLPLGDSVLG